MSRLLLKWKEACRSNRVFRTFWQAFAGYLAASIPTFWDGNGDLMLAVKALIAGAVASGLSAVWKTAEDDLQITQ